MRAPGTAAALLPGCWGGGVWTLPSPGGRLSHVEGKEEGDRGHFALLPLPATSVL